MKLTLILKAAVLILSLTSLSHAQTHGYGFIGGTLGGHAPGGAFRYGIGGAWAIAPHVTAGGELGGIHNGSSGLVASANAGVHFQGRLEPGLDPFITGGFTVVRWGGATGVYANLGGGVNYWFQRRLGLRGEFRGYPGGGNLNSFSELRIGVCFR